MGCSSGWLRGSRFLENPVGAKRFGEFKAVADPHGPATSGSGGSEVGCNRPSRSNGRTAPFAMKTFCLSAHRARLRTKAQGPGDSLGAPVTTSLSIKLASSRKANKISPVA